MNFFFKNRFLIIGGIIAIALTFLALYLNESEEALYLTVGWISITLILVWLANKYLTKQLDRRMPWLESGNKRFYWQLTTGIVISLIVINLSYLALKFGLTEDPPDQAQFISMNVIGLVVLIPLISINFGMQFLNNWKTAQLKAEAFQKETIQAELATLKNHLDPHFLFNNLNVLSSLITIDPDLSQTYLEKFADVYRAILKSSQEELITLNEELKFIASYLYLLEIRFDNTIKTFIDVESDDHKKYLPPLTLQMLIENAIKHNIVTEQKPLTIHINSQNGFISVKNNLQQKKIESRSHSHTGIDNIKKRYSYFTDKKVQVFKKPEHFIIKIPLIELDEL